MGRRQAAEAGNGLCDVALGILETAGPRRDNDMAEPIMEAMNGVVGG